jgi:hypothetical protein
LLEMDQNWRRSDHELPDSRTPSEASPPWEGDFGEEAGLATEGCSVLGACQWEREGRRGRTMGERGATEALCGRVFQRGVNSEGAFCGRTKRRPSLTKEGRRKVRRIVDWLNKKPL